MQMQPCQIPVSLAVDVGQRVGASLASDSRNGIRKRQHASAPTHRVGRIYRY